MSTNEVGYCNICGIELKPLPNKARAYSIMCEKCRNDIPAQLNRPYTKDTAFLIRKWYSEGMSVKKIADVLKRSEENVRLALDENEV